MRTLFSFWDGDGNGALHARDLPMSPRQLNEIRNLFHDEGPGAVLSYVGQLISECERRGQEVEDLKGKLADHCRDERVLAHAGFGTNWTSGAGKSRGFNQEDL